MSDKLRLEIVGLIEDIKRLRTVNTRQPDVVGQFLWAAETQLSGAVRHVKDDRTPELRLVDK